MIAIILLALFLAAGVAAATGRTPDTRDPRFGVGPMLTPKRGAGRP